MLPRLRQLPGIAFALAVLCSPAHATVYPGFTALVTDSSRVITIPVAPRPAYLVPAIDPTFQAPVTRIGGDPGTAFVMSATGQSGVWGRDARHNYSKTQPWNADQTLILFENPGSEGGSPTHLILDGETYLPLYGRCAYTLDDMRWHPSRAHARELIGVRETRDSLVWFDPTTCTVTRGWRLPIQPHGIGFGEGNASNDGRFIAMANADSIVIVDMDPQPPYASYAEGNRRIGPVYAISPCSLSTSKPTTCEVGHVSITSSGRYVDLKFAGVEDAHRIFEVDPVTLEIRPHAMDDASLRCDTFQGRPNGWIFPLKHADNGLDPFDNDEDVLVGGRACSGSTLGRVVKVRLRDGKVTALTDPTNEASVRHLSMRALERPGWVYVSSYKEIGTRFSDEIFAVKLDGSRAVQRFAHTHSDASTYRSEPHAVPSPDGRRVMWASNWYQDCNPCGSRREVQAYVVDARAPLGPDRAPLLSLPATVAAYPGESAAIAVAASDPDGNAIDALDADLSTLPPGHDAVFDSNPAHTAGTLRWTPQIADAGASYTVTFTARNALETSGAVTIQVLPPDAPPSLAAPDTAFATELATVSVPVSASDPDGEPVDSLTADLSALPAGSDAAFSADETHTLGTLTWTPTYADGGRAYPVTFRAANRRLASRTTWIVVANLDRPPVVQAPAAAAANEGQAVTVAVTASDPDGDPIASLQADLSSLTPAGPASFVANGTNTGGTLTWTPAVGSGREAPYDVVFTVNAVGATATTTTSIAVNRAPVAALAATPESGTAPLVVTADASGSADPDGTVATYTFGFGDGTSAGPQASPTASHTYAAGSYSLTVTVTDDDGASSSATRSIAVSAPPATNLVGNPDFESGTTGWSASGSATLARVTPGHGGTWALEVRGTSSSSSSAFGITDNPNWVATTGTVGKTYRLGAWVRSASHRGSARIKVREFVGSSQKGSTVYSSGVTLSPAWQALAVDYVTRAAGSYLDVEILDSPRVRGEIFQVDDVSITTAASSPDQPPVVVAPASATVAENAQVVIDVTASDPDGAITSFTPNLSGLPAGNNAAWTTNGSKTTGRLTWTPGFADGRATPYAVTFTAANALSGSASTAITVANVDRAPVVTAFAAATVQKGTTLSLTVTAADPDGDAITTLTSNFASLPAPNDAAFTVNAAKTGGTLTWTPAATDGPGPYAVTFTAANALAGTATTSISVGDPPPAGSNLVGNPGFETDLGGWVKNGTATLSRVTGGHTGTYCAQVATTSSGTYGITDSPSWIATVPAAGITYRLTAWVRSDLHKGAGKIKVREFVGGTQQGSSAYSAGVTLSPAWQLVTMDYVTRTAGSFLDVEVNDYPVAGGEVIQIDDVSIVLLSSVTAPAARLTPQAQPEFRVALTPNPIRAEGVLHLTLTRPGAVRLEIFDVTGRRVAVPVRETMLEPGDHERAFALRDRRGGLSGGIYLYRLHSAEGTRSGRFVVVN